MIEVARRRGDTTFLKDLQYAIEHSKFTKKPDHARAAAVAAVAAVAAAEAVA